MTSPANPGVRPAPTNPNFSSIPPTLRDLPQWVLWRWGDSQSPQGKWEKVPYDANGKGQKGSSTNSSTWGSFTQVRHAYEQGGFDGVGFVVTDDDDLAGFDIDGCRNPVTGELTTQAQALLRMANSYTEVSPSQTGIRIWVHVGGWQVPDGTKKLGTFECYTAGRFLTVTGQHVPGTPTTVENQSQGIDKIHAVHVALGEQSKKPRPAVTTAVPTSGAAPRLTDNQVLNKMLSSQNGPAHRRLWEGDTSAYRGDDSAADLALCNALVWWTNHDLAQVDRLFRRSGLMRPKWDSARGESTYGGLTIERADKGTERGYTGSCPPLCQDGKVVETHDAGGADQVATLEHELTQLREELRAKTNRIDQLEDIVRTQRFQLSQTRTELQTMRTNHELERRIFHRDDLRDIAPTAVGFAYALPASTSHGTKSNGGILYDRTTVGERYGLKKSTLDNQTRKLVERGWIDRDPDPPRKDPETGKFSRQAIAHPTKRCRSVTEYLESILDLPAPKPRADPETGEILEPRRRGGNQKGKSPMVKVCSVDPGHELVEVPDTDAQNGPRSVTQGHRGSSTKSAQNGPREVNWGHFKREPAASAIVREDEPCSRCHYTDWQRSPQGQWYCAVCSLPYPGQEEPASIRERVGVLQGRLATAV